LCNQDRYALITDTANNTIRKLDIASLTVTTIAGTAGVVGSTDGSGGLVRFNGPRGISIDHDCSRALVADSYNHTIRVIDLTTNQVATLTGSAEYFGNADGAGTNARFDTPVDVTLAGNGSLALVADTGNSSLRYIGNHYIYIPISLP
jgi:DNA-binding beta-propeller fold protein YncE